MGLLTDAIADKKFDTRIVEKNVSRSVVSSQEVKSHVESLPDDSDAGEWVNVDELKGDSDSPRSEAPAHVENPAPSSFEQPQAPESDSTSNNPFYSSIPSSGNDDSSSNPFGS